MASSRSRSAFGDSAAAEQSPRQKGFRRLLEATRIVQWEADASTRDFTYVGSQAERLLGYGLDNWYEPSFWKSHLHLDDRERVLRLGEMALTVRDVYDLEYRLVAATGQSVWVHDVVAVERVADRPAVLRGFLIDITKRKQAETMAITSQVRLRQLIDRFRIAATLGADIIAEIDIKTGQVEWFGQIDEARGYESGEFPRTIEGWADQVHPEDRERIQADVEREVFERRRGLSAEFRIRAKNSIYRHWTLQLAPRPEGPQRPIMFVAVCSDVTEQVIARAEALQHRDALAHVARVSSLGELTATLAHELNQPLAAILSNAQAAVRLLDRATPDVRQTRDVLRDIILDDRRASGIIRRLREMMRRDTPTRERIDLAQMVREVREIMRGGLALRGITVLTEFSEGLPSVVADRIQIQQVVVNLLTNAMQAMDGRPEPTLKVTVRERGRGGQVVSVADNGPGIAPPMLEKMFEPFTGSREDGLGMGLSISRSIIHGFDGRIWATNQPGSGAVVSFELPVDSGSDQ